MMLALHKNARTTPTVRAEIAASGEASARELSQRYGVTEATIYKWKARDSTADRSHTAHRLQTILTPAQEAIVAALHKACPIKITRLLTDNGKEFTDRLFASRSERAPSDQHEFDLLCPALGIEHRLTRPRTPQTNGMVERFNGRIADVLKTHRFHSGEDLEHTLLRYVALYNHQLPQSALKSKTPIQAMKAWYDSHPHLFIKRPCDRPGCDN